MSKVVLIASDQGKFEVEENVARKSQLLKNMIEDTGVEEEIYLPNVKSAPLKKII
jgi:S-phase kinase-associated protein 1